MFSDLSRKISFLHFSSKFQSAVALRDAQRQITYRQLSAHIYTVMRNFEKDGLQPGDRLAIIAENSLEYVILLLASWQYGLVTVPLNTRWAMPEIRRQLKKLSCKNVFVSRQKMAEVSEYFSSVVLSEFIRIDEIAESDEKSIQQPGVDSARALDLTKDVSIIFTSGSSSAPKGAVHSLGNYVFSAIGSNSNIPLKMGDCWLLSLPLFHVGGIGILFRALLSGAAIFIETPDNFMWQNLGKLGVTHLSLVYTQLYRLMQKDSTIHQLKLLKAILLGGSSFPRNVIEACELRQLKIHRSYGSTEMASQVATSKPGESGANLLTAGQILPYREIKIQPDHEIYLRGKTLFRGYWTPNGIDTSIFENGWFPTGDLGYFDKTNNLVIHGRKDVMFISGGENIHPAEIETAICSIKSVYDAVVIDYPDAEFGFRPVAFVKMAENAEFSETDIRNNLRVLLSGYKIPKHIFPWPQGIEQENFKLRRDLFRKIAEKELSV